ncbi:MAG: TetR family transcriptional regulator [Devosia sp.]
MGHKEDLLAGAKKMLLERGFAHTTARDIVAASGTNLASIGYHFGSKDALMMQAMIDLMAEFGERFSPPELRNAEMPSDEKFVAAWQRIITAFEVDRPLMVASYDVLGQMEHAPELRLMMREAYEMVRTDMAFDFLNVPEGTDPATVRAVSSVLLAMLSGLLVQYLVDPATAPKAEDLAAGIRFIGRALG